MRNVWLALKHQFITTGRFTPSTTTLRLGTSFRAIYPSLNIFDGSRARLMLSNLSEHVRLLNITHGLNRTFSSIGPQLRHARPFPTFLEAWADLLEELRNPDDT